MSTHLDTLILDPRHTQVPRAITPPQHRCAEYRGLGVLRCADLGSYRGVSSWGVHMPPSFEAFLSRENVHLLSLLGVLAFLRSIMSVDFPGIRSALNVSITHVFHQSETCQNSHVLNLIICCLEIELEALLDVNALKS
ncbi:hypothetical protein VNO78_19585 [Psophocarpus tetragonolobus]|uniref:Uncharacterized protein n=1 Tax=Psophocarpus tetragonolobus TaxID=3891 RepID=A0AAN9SBN2_PSOTE